MARILSRAGVSDKGSVRESTRHRESLAVSLWREISDDPNSAAALELRQRTLDDALCPGIDDRVAYLVTLAAGKSVLDVGVVDHAPDALHSDDWKWLHAEIAQSASHCLGIDVLEDEVLALQEQGFNVRVADIVTVELNESFDVIVAGEVIEHLGNPAGLFEAARRCLRPGGVLVITTPNPFYVNRVWHNWRSRVTDNVDHIALFWPSGVAELAERAGLRLRAYRPVRRSTAPEALKGKLFHRLGPLWRWMKLSPLTEAETIIYEVEYRHFGNERGRLEPGRQQAGST